MKKIIIAYLWVLTTCSLGLLSAVALLSFWNPLGFSASIDGPADIEMDKHAWPRVLVECTDGWVEVEISNHFGGAFNLNYPMAWWGRAVEVYRTPEGEFYYLLDFPLWLPIALLAIWPACRVVGALRRRRRARHGLCIKCGYDLTGNTSGVCPECGEKI